MASHQSAQLQSNLSLQTETKNLTIQQINSARAEAAMEAFKHRNKQMAEGTARSEGGEGRSSSESDDEYDVVEQTLKDLKVE